MEQSVKPRAAAPMLSEFAEALLTFLGGVPDKAVCDKCAAGYIGANRHAAMNAVRELILKGAILCFLTECAICAERRVVAQVRRPTSSG